MRRFLPTILTLALAFGVAAPAYADKGGNWLGWRGQHRERGDRDHRPPPGGQNNPGDPPGANEGQGGGRYDNRQGNDDRQWGRRREHDRAREGVMRGRMIPLEDLENRIARSTPGYRIGNPEFIMFGGRPVYRIRWRTPDGHILVVFADAETGQIIDIRGR
jgi:hypothetical protein